MKTIQLLIQGKVQGVFYRASAKEKADKLGIRGWVKNTEDGDVAILCQGPEMELGEFINWCRQGPPRARVEHIELKEITAALQSGFTILRASK
jgi:acylphosphatase